MNDETQRINKMIAEMKGTTRELSDDQLEMARKFKKQMSQLIEASEALKQYQDGANIFRTFYEMNQRVISIAEQFYDNGIIKNRETVDRAVSSFIYSPVALDFKTHFKFIDATVSFKKMFDENMALINKLSIPHISLYQNVFDSIDDASYEKVEKVVEEQLSGVEEEGIEQEREIKHPAFFDAAVKIQIYVNITENVIAEKGDVEQETVWRKIVKPFMETLRAFLVAWAFGNAAIGDMGIAQAFEKVIEAVESYQYSIETTEVEINDLEIMDMKTNQVEETDLEIKE
ncbi:hypothetical protein [Domibacillus sp.]|uniref:hypothetical protein n=1 Tax=Domibacillus sp. TaxID=1969783 RepID=UPI0028120ABC|nr:hypothetical protein [Domibacillus sp.]